MTDSPTPAPQAPSGDRPVALSVNGEPYRCPEGMHLPDLLADLGLNPRLLAVEYNGEILHRQYWADREVQPGDRVEIVTIVGGG